MSRTINAENFVAKGTGFHSFVGWTLLLLVGPIFFLALVLVSYGIVLVAGLIALLMQVARRKKAVARLRGSAVKVNDDQFPEIHASIQDMAERLGLPHCPEAYIVEDNTQNAFAIKHGAKGYIILIDDVVYGALATGNQKALDFIIGHELAHHALGHTGLLRGQVSQKYRILGRLDEFSCDAVALALIEDAESARDALGLLLIGPQLYRQLNRRALDRQAREVAEDKYSKKSESGQTHPLLLRRYAKLLELQSRPSMA